MQRKRTVIYCRVDRGGNPGEQQRVWSIQREKLERYANVHRLKIVGYYQDTGYPGHDLKRPGLKQMLEDWKAGQFDSILVVDRNRMTYL